MAGAQKSASELVAEFSEAYQYCEQQYMNEWNSIYVDVDDSTSESKKEALRRDAQRAAIDKAFLNSLMKFPEIDEEVIWALISIAHKLNLAQLDQFYLNRMQRLLIYER